MISLVIPWRGGDPHRERVYDWVQRRIAATAPPEMVELVEGHDTDHHLPFNRAAACNDGIERARGEVVIIGDADIVYSLKAMYRAAWWAVVDGGWAVGYTYKCHLSEEGTNRVLAGPVDVRLSRHELMLDTVYPPPARGGTSSFVVLQREFLERDQLLRFDQRFVGWGKEDQAFAIALDAHLGQPRVCDGDLFHLWHPYAGYVSNDPHYLAAEQLYARYNAARDDPLAVRRLLKEAADAL